MADGSNETVCPVARLGGAKPADAKVAKATIRTKGRAILIAASHIPECTFHNI
jgi:hypothetical protein